MKNTVASRTTQRVEADLQMLEPLARMMLAGLIHWLDPKRWRLGTPAGDLAAVLGLPRRPEHDRLEAARRVARRIGRPVHRGRWSAVECGLKDLAVQHESTPEAELGLQVLAQIFATAPATVGRMEPEALEADPDGALQRLRTHLGRALSDDLGDPRRGSILYRPADSFDPTTEIVAYITADQLIAKARLSPLELAVIQGTRADVAPEVLAADRGIAVATVYTALHRGRRKIRALGL